MKTNFTPTSAKRFLFAALVAGLATSFVAARWTAGLDELNQGSRLDAKAAHETLAARSWLVVQGPFPELFVLKRSGELTASNPESAKFDSAREQSLLRFDPEAFKIAFGAATLREAQLKSSETPLPIAKLRAWGGLPYPPLDGVPETEEGESPEFSTLAYAHPDFQRRLDDATVSELTRNSAVELHQNGSTLQPLLGLVRRATKFVFGNFLSVVCDDATEPLMSALEERAREGLDVRLAVNGKYARLSGSCLERLEKAGIAIARGPTHSSYLVSDRDEVMIGSQSLARFFFRADGRNFLDRDAMLYARGPVATDTAADFLRVWSADAKADARKPAAAWIDAIKSKRAEEQRSGLRGPGAYASWLGEANPQGLCRFAGQSPEAEGREGITKLWSAMTRASRDEVRFTAVRIEMPAAEDANNPASDVFRALEERGRAGVEIDFVGNGPASGNGELTMVLEEWIEQGLTAGKWWAHPLRWIQKVDAEAKAASHDREYRRFLKLPNAYVWKHFNFMHEKAWSFDRHAVWIGSANLDASMLGGYYESGVLCMDSRLASDFSKGWVLDRINSVPMTR